ncbi:MAG: hypothetical protein WD711_00235 [Dongiaceae bacterium]
MTALALMFFQPAGADDAPCCPDFRGAELPVDSAYYDNPVALQNAVLASADGDILYAYLYPAGPEGTAAPALTLAVWSLRQNRLLLECPYENGDSLERHLESVAAGPFEPLPLVVPATASEYDEGGIPVGDVYVRGAEAQGTVTNIAYNSLRVFDATGAKVASVAMVYLYEKPKTMESEYGFDGYIEETRWKTRLTTLPPRLYALPDGSFLQASDRAPILLRFDDRLNCLGCENVLRLRMVPKDEFDRTLFALEDAIWASFGIGDPEVTPSLVAERFELARREGARIGLAEEDWAPNLWINWKLADLFEDWRPDIGE